MKLEKLFTECAAITKSKGFDLANYPAQILLIATEVGEALELIESHDMDCDWWCQKMAELGIDIEADRNMRKWGSQWGWIHEESEDSLLEELADIQIRLASFIGGNDLTDKFIAAVEKKVEKNMERPYLHGKKN